MAATTAGRRPSLPDPYPEDLRTLNRPGDVTARAITGRVLGEIWGQAQERPDGFMGMFCLMRRTICFAGGCFWGMEALYRRLPGVLDVTAGYANGDTADHANYDDVCTGRTGFRGGGRWRI